MAVKSSLHICYLYKTSAQEQIDVHTSHGLLSIEVIIETVLYTTMHTSDKHHDCYLKFKTELYWVSDIESAISYTSFDISNVALKWHTYLVPKP